ncbi:MAG: hypothetical protein ACI8QZ_004383 [Chlamydiales bacterium]|jgi:hypothetical protein
MKIDEPRPERKRRWTGPFFIAFVVFALIMATTSVSLLSSWSEVNDASATEAEAAFEAVRARFGDAQPYIAVEEGGGMRTTREIDSSRSFELKGLHMLSFEPVLGKLADVAFPYWFVRLKLSDAMNLGTIVSLMARDWKHLDLRVTEDDLEALGPALLLDHTRESGARLMLWSE